VTEILKHQANVAPGGGLVQRPSGFASIDLISGDNFERVERVATGLSQSGVFKDVTSTQNAMAKILLGADLGLTPTQALMNLDVVEGNARVRSVLLGAWVRQHPHYDYKVVEHDAEHCVIDFYYKGEIEGTSAFSIEDAKLAGLVKPDKPRSAWMAHPRNMLWARAMSERGPLVLPGPDGRRGHLHRGRRVHRLDGGGDRRRRG
jgi:hypothetical protein